MSRKPKKKPWMPFWIGRFLADPRVQRMDATGVGAYVLLICNLWHEGEIEEDARDLRTLMRLTPAQFRRWWPRIRACLEEIGGRPGWLHQPTVTEERAKADEISETNSANALKGWEKRRARQEAGGQVAEDDAGVDAGGDAVASESQGESPPDGEPSAMPDPCETGCQEAAGEDASHSSQFTDHTEARSASDHRKGPKQAAPAARRGEAPAGEPGSWADLPEPERGCLAFLAARRHHDPEARRSSKRSTWAEPMARLVADPDRGLPTVVALSSWLWTEYEPERPDFDWRDRVFTPKHLEDSWDRLVATRRSQQARKVGRQAGCPECGSSEPPTENTAEDAWTCDHGETLAALRTWRCPGCGHLRHHTHSVPSECDLCIPKGADGRARLTAWFSRALETAQAHSPDAGASA